MIDLEQLLAREQQLQKQIEQIEQDKKDAIEAEKIEKRIAALEEQIRQTGNEPTKPIESNMMRVGAKPKELVKPSKSITEQVLDQVLAEQMAKKPYRVML